MTELSVELPAGIQPRLEGEGHAALIECSHELTARNEDAALRHGEPTECFGIPGAIQRVTSLKTLRGGLVEILHLPLPGSTAAHFYDKGHKPHEDHRARDEGQRQEHVEFGRNRCDTPFSQNRGFR